MLNFAAKLEGHDRLKILTSIQLLDCKDAINGRHKSRN